MNRKGFTLQTSRTDVITYSNSDGRELKVFLEPLPKLDSYYRGRATFVIEGGEVTGSYYWPNLAVSLSEHIVTTHPNQLISKVFPKLEKYEYSTDIEDFRNHLEIEYADEIAALNDAQREKYEDAFDSWGEMPVRLETLYHVPNMSYMLDMVVGVDWCESDIIPKEKTAEYALVKQMITEFQKAFRGQLASLVYAP